MPWIDHCEYVPPPFLANGHLQTLYPALFRRPPEVVYDRERIPTPDGDFLDIDWSRIGSFRLALLSHGLEGNAHRNYIRGMVKTLNGSGWDCVALNFRGCSGFMNLKPRLYHSGTTDDLHTVLDHSLRAGGYRQAALIGFSMGGNQTLKYLGEAESNVPAAVIAAAVFSVPCDLEGSAMTMARPSNRIYMHSFLRSLRRKIVHKKESYPQLFDTRGLRKIRTFEEFDDRFTAPLHGFSDARDYWGKCSSLRYLGTIDRPVLLVNARNDPFLSPSCFPVREAEKNPCLFLQTPAQGGHVGFPGTPGSLAYWSEHRVVQFLNTYLSEKTT